MTQLTREQMIADMLIHQDELNSIINPDWRTANYPWHTAIWTECAELMDHLGWKWWTKQVRDVKQVRLEIADIWHFVLSLCTVKDVVIPTDYPPFRDTALTTAWYIEQLVESTTSTVVNTNRVVRDFFDLIDRLGITLEDLYKLHTGKWVLNKFRQSNGYKEGNYQKVWYDGREDNAHLYDILDELQVNEDFADKVQIRLNCVYALNSLPHAHEMLSL